MKTGNEIPAGLPEKRCMTDALSCSDPAVAQAHALFDAFRSEIRGTLADGSLAASIIGKGATVHGPLGPQPLLYADYAASGRALREVEDFVLEHVLPVYANPHTQASHCGRSINALRRSARAEIAWFCGADAGDAVIFAGSGATCLWPAEAGAAVRSRPPGRRRTARAGLARPLRAPLQPAAMARKRRGGDRDCQKVPTAAADRCRARRGSQGRERPEGHRRLFRRGRTSPARPMSPPYRAWCRRRAAR